MIPGTVVLQTLENTRIPPYRVWRARAAGGSRDRGLIRVIGVRARARATHTSTYGRALEGADNISELAQSSPSLCVGFGR